LETIKNNDEQDSPRFTCHNPSNKPEISNKSFSTNTTSLEINITDELNLQPTSINR